MVGIYKVTSPTNKIYIGQSANILNRWEYYRNLRCKKQIKIYNSLKKHGPENHIFEIIEECTLEQLNERETFHKQQIINQIGWGNVLFCELYDNGGGPKSQQTKDKIGKANIGISRNKGNKFKLGCKLSQESKNKISKSNLGNDNKLGCKLSQISKDKISKSKLGVKNSQEHNNNISKARIGIEFTQITKNKMSKAKINKPKPNDFGEKLSKPHLFNMVLCIETGKIFKNSEVASREMNISSSFILKTCKGICKQAKGYTFKFIIL